MLDAFGARGQAAWLSALAVVVLLLSLRFSRQAGHA
jgi:hypothetical protein